MPIHQTKLMIRKAHPTGLLLPKTPMPVNSSLPMAIFISISNPNPIAKPKNHPILVRLVSTMPLILSVTDSKEWAGRNDSRHLTDRAVAGRYVAVVRMSWYRRHSTAFLSRA